MTWRRDRNAVITDEDLRRVRVRLNRTEWAQGFTRKEIADKYDNNPDRLAGVVVALLERLDAIGDDLRFVWVKKKEPTGATAVRPVDFDA